MISHEQPIFTELIWLQAPWKVAPSSCITQYLRRVINLKIAAFDVHMVYDNVAF